MYKEVIKAIISTTVFSSKSGKYFQISNIGININKNALHIHSQMVSISSIKKWKKNKDFTTLMHAKKKRELISFIQKNNMGDTFLL